MPKNLKILILEDNSADAELIKRMLLKTLPGCKFYFSKDRPTFTEALDEFLPDIILSDHALPQFNSVDALSIARERYPGIPFIMVTGSVSEEFAVNIMKMGADDYILKDRMSRLPAAINTILEQRRALKEITDYKFALDQSAIVAITNQKGVILYANEKFCDISKYTKEELIGKDHRIINSGYHPASYIKTLWTTIAKGKIWRGEFCNRKKDGELYWVDTTIIPFLDQDLKPYQYLSIRIDITEKKKIEHLVKISEEKYRTIFMKSPLPIWIYELETLRFLDVNESAVRHYGYSMKEFLSMSIRDIRPAEDVDALMNDILKIKKSTESRFGTWRHIKKDGGIIIVETTAHAIEFNGFHARMVIAKDITEKIKSEAELRQSEMRLKEAQAIAHIGNWDIDLKNNLHTWSDEIYRIFALKKYKAKPSIELFISFIHPDDVEIAQQLISEAFRHPKDSKLNFRFLLKDGRLRFGNIEWRYEFDNNRTPIRLFGILQDITERKKAEDNMKLLEQTIQEQKIKEQKRITRAIITGQEKERNHIGQELHDNINQILAGSKMYLSSAGKKNKELEELIKYPLELIDLSINEIRLLCQKLIIPVKNIKLEELVGELLNKLRQNTGIKTTYSYAIPDGILPDELKLNMYRIIQEQVNNIIKYAEARNVNISIKTGDGILMMIVEDDGKGFDTSLKKKGVGILNMINRAESFNGSVVVYSSPGKGCKITVTIPC